jgi:hypothetical protein
MVDFQIAFLQLLLLTYIVAKIPWRNQYQQLCWVVLPCPAPLLAIDQVQGLQHKSSPESVRKVYRSGMGIFTLGSISKEVSGNTNIHQSIYACV